MTSSAQLQREADAARVGLADTLGQLREGMAPSVLSSEVLALVKDSGLSIVKSLAEQARSNPVPALLIGAGLTMLLTRTTGGDVMGVANSALKSAASTGADAARGAASGVASAAKSAASSAAYAAKSAASTAASAASGAASAASGAVKDAASSVAGRATGVAERATGAVSDAASAMRNRVTGAVDHASQSAADGYASAKDTYATAKDKLDASLDAGRRELHDRQDQAAALGEEARQKAETMAEQARQSFSRLLEEQPILMAALGVALGAALGAALPVSAMEKDLIGPTGAKAIGAGREALASAADVVRQEAASADIPGKVGALADKVVQGVSKQV